MLFGVGDDCCEFSAVVLTAGVAASDGCATPGAAAAAVDGGVGGRSFELLTGKCSDGAGAGAVVGGALVAVMVATIAAGS